MKDIFKEGDRVFHIQHGWGTIRAVLSDMYVFDKGDENLGFPKDNNKTLSFTEYTLEGFSQERPEKLPNKGDIVWVRDEFPSEWIIGHFLKKADGRYYVSRDNKNSNGWGYEIRTTNPYENEN